MPGEGVGEGEGRLRIWRHQIWIDGWLGAARGKDRTDPAAARQCSDGVVFAVKEERG
jgi:hypothetical protein